jgi:hypothetical protein
MSKNQKGKILLEKIEEYEPKYFQFAGVRNNWFKRVHYFF